MEIALEIEKVKHGHGKRETGRGEASGRDFLRNGGAREAQEASQVRRRTHSHDEVYVYARAYTCKRLSA